MGDGVEGANAQDPVAGLRLFPVAAKPAVELHVREASDVGNKAPDYCENTPRTKRRKKPMAGR
jgi:hypothetical protein